MADLHTFWNELDALPTEETPLTAAESDRLADAVLAKVHAESGEAPRKKSVHRAKSAKRRRVPVWGRALAGVAACMAILCGVNTVNPALAEGLPFVGDVFSFLNQHDSKNQLKSDRLSGYAQQAAVPAVSESQSETGESSTASPYTLTLNQVYCDGLYLRIGLTLTAPDGNDSLAGYDWLAQNPGGEGWIEICQAQADGTLLANGQALYPQNGFVFEKVDDHTYAAAMDYDLADYNGDTAAIDCQLTVAGLTGVQNAYDADGSYLRTRLDGRWKLNFTASSGRYGQPYRYGFRTGSQRLYVVQRDRCPRRDPCNGTAIGRYPRRRHAAAVLRGWPKAAMRQQPPQCRQQRRQLRL